MPAMWVEQVATQVVEVLARAESLFADPGDAAASTSAADTTDAAADASAAIAAPTADLAGSAAQAHAALLAAASRHLENVAGTDAQLADRLDHAVEIHGDGLSQAGQLRTSAADVPASLQPWADLPASELAALKALRRGVADMQQLTSHHSELAAQMAGQIRTLGFQP